MESDDIMSVPTWLERLLNTSFFSICKTHGDAPKCECNMYCLDCNNNSLAFCFYCRSSKHKDHHVIQIRRSSYHDVVRVSEIQRALDLSGIQTYVINSARVMFLNERPQPKSTGKGSSHLCEICGRSLLDPFRFCSLGCKVEGIKRGGNASFCLDAKNETGMSSRRSKEEDAKELPEDSQQDIYPPTPPPPPASTARRRKGIPNRAPFGTKGSPARPSPKVVITHPITKEIISLDKSKPPISETSTHNSTAKKQEVIKNNKKEKKKLKQQKKSLKIAKMSTVVEYLDVVLMETPLSGDCLFSLQDWEVMNGNISQDSAFWLNYHAAKADIYGNGPFDDYTFMFSLPSEDEDYLCTYSPFPSSKRYYKGQSLRDKSLDYLDLHNEAPSNATTKDNL